MHAYIHTHGLHVRAFSNLSACSVVWSSIRLLTCQRPIGPGEQHSFGPSGDCCRQGKQAFPASLAREEKLPVWYLRKNRNSSGCDSCNPCIKNLENNSSIVAFENSTGYLQCQIPLYFRNRNASMFKCCIVWKIDVILQQKPNYFIINSRSVERRNWWPT